jgi:hypothetical protein
VRVALVTRANTSESTSSRCHGPSPVSRRCIGAALSAAPPKQNEHAKPASTLNTGRHIRAERRRHRRGRRRQRPAREEVGVQTPPRPSAPSSIEGGTPSALDEFDFCNDGGFSQGYRPRAAKGVVYRATKCRGGHGRPGALRPALVYRHLMAPAKTRGQSGTARNGAAPRTSSVVAATDVARRAYDLNVARGCRHDLGEGWTRRLVRFAFGPQPIFNHSFVIWRRPRAGLHLARPQHHRTRQDLGEALAFAAEGKVTAHIHRTSLEGVNRVFEDLRAGHVDGRMVLEIGASTTRTLASHNMASA